MWFSLHKCIAISRKHLFIFIVFKFEYCIFPLKRRSIYALDFSLERKEKTFLSPTEFLGKVFYPFEDNMCF